MHGRQNVRVSLRFFFHTVQLEHVFSAEEKGLYHVQTFGVGMSDLRVPDFCFLVAIYHTRALPALFARFEKLPFSGLFKLLSEMFHIFAQVLSNLGYHALKVDLIKKIDGSLKGYRFSCIN